MDFFKLEQHTAPLLRPFPEIFEFGYEKYNRVCPGSLKQHMNPGIEICFIKEGKYNWVIEDQQYILYPKNASVTLPWELHGSKEGFLDIGILFWIIILPEKINSSGALQLSNSFSQDGSLTHSIGKILASKSHPVIYNGSVAGRLFEELATEIFTQPFGYINRVYHLVYDLLLNIARSLIEETDTKEDVYFKLNKLDAALHADLDYNWSVEEMAAIVGRGITSFTAILKKKTGFTPLNYLIQLRIEEAKKLLMDANTKVTDVAWRCGFSSSQHFSNTFKQKTGISPSQFVKSNLKKLNGYSPIQL